MGKLSKREVKEQEEIFKLLEKEKLTLDERIHIYENINIGYISNVSTGNAYFTPWDFSADLALMSWRYGRVVDIAAGIGCLSMGLYLRDMHEKNIESYTCIELNPEYARIGKKLFPEANWIIGDIFDKELWENLTSSGQNKFNLAVSNPPFSSCPKELKPKLAWLNYQDNLELCAVELALRYSEHASFILPAGSVDFKTYPYYQKIDNRKMKKFKEKNSSFFFEFEYMSIDASVYEDQWKNLNGIKVEAVEINMNKEDYKSLVEVPANKTS